MNSWKEYPQLFWKFICLSEASGNKARHYVWWILSNDMIGFKNNWINDCTLIARRIEDMTDAECRKVINKSSFPYAVKEKLINESGSNSMLAKDERYLLSIGVYPGPQSHFGKDVIDIKTLSE